VTIDTFVQRLGDAAAAGVYKIAETLLLRGPSAVAICALPVSVIMYREGSNAALALHTMVLNGSMQYSVALCTLINYSIQFLRSTAT
jgi:hypothetical protein